MHPFTVLKTGRFVICFCASILFAIPFAYAQDVQQLPAPDNSDLSISSSDPVNETSLNWFVELGSAPTADGGSLTATKNDKQNFRKNAKAAGLKFTERRSFDVLWNGLSIHLADASQLGALSRIAGVKEIYPVLQVRVDPIAAPAVPDLTTALAMTGANIAQDSLGYTGQGIKVAVMDTGIDYDHPGLGGCFGPGCRVAKGYDFVGDAYDAGAATPVITPDPFPDDCAGHGTHVAGIIGANDANIKGVAPEATLYAYRVFGCVGSTDSDIMLAAMERALNDGAQILNMSIGAAFQTWPQYPTAQGADRLVNKGVIVVASIGNSGANGLYSAGAPGVGSKVIGVASVDNTAIRVRAFTVNPDGRDIGYFESNGTVVSPQGGTFPMERTSATLVADDGCAALPDLAGKIALIRRGTCGFYNKALNAQRAHAVGVVLFNNTAAAPALLSPSVTPVAPDTETITIPVVFVTQTDGQFIHSQLGLGPVNLTWNPSIHTITLPGSPLGLISSFSSYGLAADLSLKPDISAPGGNIFSTYPLELGGYTSISGTSMASPHTAGIAALYLQAHPGTNSQVMRSILQNTAVPRLWFGNPALGFNEVVARSGAGLVQADKAILATTFISPGKLSLGESEAGPVTQTLTIRNDGPDVVTYDLSRVDGVSARSTFTPAFSIAASTVSFSVAGLPVTSVSLSSGQTVNLDVAISPNPALADRTLYGGHIVFTPQGGGQVYRVPYAGLKGNYQSIVGMPSVGPFPTIGRQVAPNSFVLAGAGATFTLANAGEIPFFLVHLDHQVRSLKVDVIDAVTAKNWQRGFFQEYLPRNSTATGFFALPFDGNTLNGNIVKPVPNGTYFFRVTVVKALGDAANPADVETFTSANFVIARP